MIKENNERVLPVLSQCMCVFSLATNKYCETVQFLFMPYIMCVRGQEGGSYYGFSAHFSKDSDLTDDLNVGYQLT